MASYEQISKGNWKVTISLGFDSNGKRLKQKKQGFKTKREAEIWATEITSKKHKGYVAPIESNILFKDYLVDKWFYEYKVHLISMNTKNDYISRMNTHIIPMLGHYKLTALTTSVMQEFYNKLINEKKIKAVSAKKVMDIITGCLKYAKTNKLIYELPTDIQKQKLEKPKIKYWTKSEVNFFLSEIKDTYLYTPIFIDVLTGLRIGELCGLRWCDVDLEKRTITINNQLVHDKRLKVLMLADLKTSSSYRVISIPKVLITHLTELKENRNANDLDYVVLDKAGQRYTPRSLSMNFTKKVFKYKKSIDDMKKEKEKIPKGYIQLKQISFHGLRHYVEC
ncbi:site-specific integrase [Clostridium sp.]|uniref:site-specific integrase n=1 Tax=Clostridium sp. TaxID=1506 RepID=UPI00260B7EFF|nr:site-specific integrase [Clostridium sp.]